MPGALQTNSIADRKSKIVRKTKKKHKKTKSFLFRTTHSPDRSDHLTLNLSAVCVSFSRLRYETHNTVFAGSLEFASYLLIHRREERRGEERRGEERSRRYDVLEYTKSPVASGAAVIAFTDRRQWRWRWRSAGLSSIGYGVCVCEMHRTYVMTVFSCRAALLCFTALTGDVVRSLLLP